MPAPFPPHHREALLEILVILKNCLKDPSGIFFIKNQNFEIGFLIKN